MEIVQDWPSERHAESDYMDAVQSACRSVCVVDPDLTSVEKLGASTDSSRESSFHVFEEKRLITTPQE